MNIDGGTYKRQKGRVLEVLEKRVNVLVTRGKDKGKIVCIWPSSINLMVGNENGGQNGGQTRAPQGQESNQPNPPNQAVNQPTSTTPVGNAPTLTTEEMRLQVDLQILQELRALNEKLERLNLGRLGHRSD